MLVRNGVRLKQGMLNGKWRSEDKAGNVGKRRSEDKAGNVGKRRSEDKEGKVGKSRSKYNQ